MYPRRAAGRLLEPLGLLAVSWRTPGAFWEASRIALGVLFERFWSIWGVVFECFLIEIEIDRSSVVRRRTVLWLEFWRPEPLRIVFSGLQNVEDV